MHMQSKTLAIANQKGGVGKTTTAVNLGAALAERSFRVLLIDLDAQAHLTINLGFRQPDDLEPTIYNVLTEPELLASESILRAESIGVDVIPSNIELSAAELTLLNELGRESILRDKLAPLQTSYDFIIIDCPPSLSLLSINAMVAADEVIIPLQCEYFGMKGMQRLHQSIDRVRAKLNPTLRIGGILPTIHKARTLHSREVLQLVKDNYGDLVYPFSVNDSIRFAETPLAGVSILQYDPKSDGARAYRQLAQAVIASKVDDSVAAEMG